MQTQPLRVNGSRLRESLEIMAQIGKTPGGGVTRLALTDEDRTARDLFVSWLKELDLEIIIDEMGNIFGIYPGLNHALPRVLTGSHMDSQPQGGRFDGILGVMGALEVIRCLREHAITPLRSICIVNWTNEEGSRFSPAMCSSGVWAGALERDWIYDRTDSQGNRFEDALTRIGYKGPVPARCSHPIHVYYEYHIEQGPVLAREGKIIGAPHGIVGVRWFNISVTGESNHAGTTPMDERTDALCAAAEMILCINRFVRNLNDGTVATVGEIENYPNSRNVIPSHTFFTVDTRSWHEDRLDTIWNDIHAKMQLIALKRGCSIHSEEIWRVGISEFDTTCVQRVVRVAETMQYPVQRMVSGAGHDASYISQIAPTAMIFVPSGGGKSHSEDEKTTWEDCEAGANVLLHCIVESANDESPKGGR